LRDLKAIPEVQRIPASLSESAVAALLRHLDGVWKDLAILALDTGMRRSELQRLSWDDVDFEGNVLRVEDTKNGEFRLVPMTQRVRNMLTMQMKAEGPVVEFDDPKKALNAAAKAAGIGHVHLHMLRHTFASRLRDKGVPIDRIQALLGHKSLQMTLRYAKLRDAQLHKAIEALDE
jgi:integrase